MEDPYSGGLARNVLTVVQEVPLRSQTLWFPLVAAVVASMSVPEPAGACSIYCPGEIRPLSLVEVVLVDGDTSAPLPVWPESGEFEAEVSGDALGIDLTSDYLSLDPEVTP
jgi:hypothetical protein